MADRVESDEAAGGGDLVYRQRWPTRIWHWVNALTILVMLTSGMMIFNAHPQLYWGAYGNAFDHPWFEIGHNGPHGFARVGTLSLPTTGVLGVSRHSTNAFPPWMTLPRNYDLANARNWHFTFAWLLVVGAMLYWAWSFASRHAQRDLAPTGDELKPKSLWRDIKRHALLRLPTGQEARRYNVLQKLAYVSVIFVLLPLMALTGMAMSPTLDVAWPVLVDVFGGRQSARSIHFVCASLIVAFIAVHLLMVVLAGPLNELRSIVTGWYRLPKERDA